MMLINYMVQQLLTIVWLAVDVTANNNEVSGNPTFTDAANDDYTLSPSSTGVDAGDNTYVSGISNDLAEY